MLLYVCWSKFYILAFSFDSAFAFRTILYLTLASIVSKDIKFYKSKIERNIFKTTVYQKSSVEKTPVEVYTYHICGTQLKFKRHIQWHLQTKNVYFTLQYFEHTSVDLYLYSH